MKVDEDIVTFWLQDKNPKCQSCFVRTVTERMYIYDVRINPWDVADWKPEWPRYNSHHCYSNTELHKYRDTLINIGSKNIRTKHFLLHRNGITDK